MISSYSQLLLPFSPENNHQGPTLITVQGPPNGDLLVLWMTSEAQTQEVAASDERMETQLQPWLPDHSLPLTFNFPTKST